METPDRVLFVNMKDGKVFFDCHPAEARAAMEAVEDMRKNGDHSTKEQRKFAVEIEKAKNIASSLSWRAINDYKEYATNGLTPDIIADMFKKAEEKNIRVTHLVMNAVRYADLRLFGRDIMDMETKAWKLRLGCFATIWGADVILTRECTDNVVAVVSTDAEEDGVNGWCVRRELKFTGAPPPAKTEQSRVMEMLENISLRLEGVEKKLPR